MSEYYHEKSEELQGLAESALRESGAMGRIHADLRVYHVDGRKRRWHVVGEVCADGMGVRVAAYTGSESGLLGAIRRRMSNSGVPLFREASGLMGAKGAKGAEGAKEMEKTAEKGKEAKEGKEETA